MRVSAEKRCRQEARKSRYNGVSVRALVFATLAGAPLLSGCVGSTVSSTLDSAALDSPTDLMSLDDGYESDFTTLSALPVPVRSPVSSQMSLASAETNPVVDAVNEVAGQAQPQDLAALQSQTEPVQAGEAPAEPADLRTAALAATEPAEKNPITGSVTPAIAPEQTPTVQPAPKKPGGLLAALFGPRPKAPLAKKEKPTVIARANTEQGQPSAQSNLPGVKRSSILFGVQGDASDSTDSASNEGVQVASVGSFGRFRTVNGLILQTENVKVECFKPDLMRILRVVERHYGKKVMVTSGYRSPKRNRRAGGVRNSSHIYCKAADIQVEGVSKWDLAKFLRTVDGRGGVGTYCRTRSVHVDTGSVRDWHHPCRRSKSRVKKKA